MLGTLFYAIALPTLLTAWFCSASQLSEDTWHNSSYACHLVGRWVQNHLQASLNSSGKKKKERVRCKCNRKMQLKLLMATITSGSDSPNVALMCFMATADVFPEVHLHIPQGKKLSLISMVLQRSPGNITFVSAWSTSLETATSIVGGHLSWNLSTFCDWHQAPWQPFYGWLCFIGIHFLVAPTMCPTSSQNSNSAPRFNMDPCQREGWHTLFVWTVLSVPGLSRTESLREKDIWTNKQTKTQKPPPPHKMVLARHGNAFSSLADKILPTSSSPLSAPMLHIVLSWHSWQSLFCVA